MLFAYMQEQGANGLLDSIVKSNPSFLSTASVSSIAQKLYDELQADGISSITLGQITQSLSTIEKNSVSTTKNLQTKGVAEIESEMVQEFLTLSQTSQNNSTMTAALNRRRIGFAPTGHLLRIVAEPLSQAQCSMLAELSAESTALAIAAALWGAEPVALAFEAAALAYDAEAAAGGCDNN